MRLGICAFPLSRGKETGRGLERLIDEFCAYLTKHDVNFDFYDRGVIRNEYRAVVESAVHIATLARADNNCYFAVYAVSGIFPALLGKRPLVTLITDLIPFHVTGYDGRLKYAIKRSCAKISCARSDLIIVGSASIKDEIVSRFRLHPKKVLVVPWGVDHGTYHPSRDVARQRGRVAFLGEIKRAKGVDALIAAFRIVIDRVPEATLSIGGSGRDLEEMKRLAASLLPAGSFAFEGFIPEERMNAFYNCADVFVFPSRYGFGLSALEAMACGTPALVGNSLDAKDFFFDEELLVDPDDPAQVAGRIVALLANEENRRLKARQAVEFAAKFSWAAMNEQYLAACMCAASAKRIGQ
jgi:glycosyltransferase involved in cell wall biosynthesis